jgi:FkbM family methyltransferase
MKITKEGFAVLENDTHLSRWVEECGRLDHDGAIAEKILPLIQEGQHVVDVGAALGDHTVAYARKVGPTGSVLAIEPNPIQFECLKHNMAQFPWVHLLRVGLGIRPCKAILVEDPNVSQGYLKCENDGDIEVTTLDLAMNGLQVDFIKVDVEGNEVGVLWGSVDTLNRCRPKLLIEINPRCLIRVGFTPLDVFDFLTLNGYGYRVLIGEDTGIQYDILAEPA